MENLLDYLLYALFGHNVTEVIPHSKNDHESLTGKAWTIIFEGQVYITLDEHDITIIRFIYKERYEQLDDEERARYEKIFNFCK